MAHWHVMTVIFGKVAYSLRPALRPISYVCKRAREEGGGRRGRRRRRRGEGWEVQTRFVHADQALARHNWRCTEKHVYRNLVRAMRRLML